MTSSASPRGLLRGRVGPPGRVARPTSRGPPGGMGCKQSRGADGASFSLSLSLTLSS